MVRSVKISHVYKKHEQTEVEWKIRDFFSTAEDENFGYHQTESFSFAGVLWHLKLWPEFQGMFDEMRLLLERENLVECPIAYYLSLKRVDGNLEQISSGVLENDRGKTFYYPIKRSELIRRKEELVPSGVLTVMCSLKLGANTHSTETFMSDKVHKKFRSK